MAKNDQGKSMSEQQFFQNYADNVQTNRHMEEVQQQMRTAYAQPRPAAPSWMNKPLSPQAKAYFSQPANKCQMCGAEGTLGQTGDPAKDEWERKWSVHDVCAHAVWDQLDRSSGIASQRRG